MTFYLYKVQEFNTPTDDGQVLIINKSAIDSDTLNQDIISAVLINDFNKMKEKAHQLQDPSSIFDLIFNNIDSFDQDKRPGVILKVAQYAFWDSQVRDRLVNALACLVEVANV